jgi:rubrerythrin
MTAKERLAMTVEQALRLALKSEQTIRDHYANGAKKLTDAAGQKVFATLAREEQGHVEYLERRLAEWSRDGKVDKQRLTSILPPPSWVKEAQRQHKHTATHKLSDKSAIDLLKTALALEQQTSAFYGKLVAELPAADRSLFEPFLAVEEGHVLIVQAELDSVCGTGFWFDMMEFSLEAQ